jgi:hypothetical protein
MSACLQSEAGAFCFPGDAMAETPTESQKKAARFDGNDGFYYLGLLFLGIGLGFGVTWQMAMIVVGAILTVVSVVNSYVLVWMSGRP